MCASMWSTRNSILIIAFFVKSVISKPGRVLVAYLQSLLCTRQWGNHFGFHLQAREKCAEDDSLWRKKTCPYSFTSEGCHESNFFPTIGRSCCSLLLQCRQAPSQSLSDARNDRSRLAGRDVDLPYDSCRYYPSEIASLCCLSTGA